MAEPRDKEPRRATAGGFEKGRSGNPKGRPRKARGEGAEASAFDVIVEKTLTITRDGVPREVTVEEALQHRTYQAALAGDRAARREILRMIAKREAALAKTRRRRQPTRPVEMKREALDPRNVDDALLILGIACEDPRDYGPNDEYRRLLLEPWAVQLALSRRRGGAALRKKDVDEIRRCTRDPDSLRWSRSVDR